jgi:hypothetical protein
MQCRLSRTGPANKQSPIYSAFCSLYGNKEVAMTELPEKKFSERRLNGKP